jgi:hypothetical protein
MSERAPADRWAISTFIVSAGSLHAEEFVEKKTFAIQNYRTVRGDMIEGVRVGWESYGSLNADKSNAILITHFPPRRGEQDRANHQNRRHARRAGQDQGRPGASRWHSRDPSSARRPCWGSERTPEG